jgi:uracil-DNA glycosylase family protein
VSATEQHTAAAVIPDGASLEQLRAIAAGCTACDLHETGTQTVFGEGAHDAAVVFVGEQPGDIEDQEGHPFVGPAGAELDRALDAVGLGEVPQYRTNVVKHFKWTERRGKRRIHESPNTIEIRSCLPWLQEELKHTDPAVLVPLGATAVKGVLGSKVKVTRERGKVHAGPRQLVTIPTVHPSSVLRARSDADRYAAREAFQADLAVIAEVVRDGPRTALERLTVAELTALADDLEVEVTGRPRKAGLVELVAGAFAAA